MNIQQLLTQRVSQAMILAGADNNCDALIKQSAKVQFGDYQANGIMATAKNNGILEGDDAGNANPEAYITREQMAKTAVQILGGNSSETDTSVYSDDASISSWAREYVYTARRLGIMYGVEDNIFAPKSAVPREQAMVLTYRVRGKYGGK